jgi:hypothetical protein
MRYSAQIQHYEYGTMNTIAMRYQWYYEYSTMDTVLEYSAMNAEVACEYSTMNTVAYGPAVLNTAL